MKVVTLQQLEENFDEILEDVTENKEHYRIQHEVGDVMLIPIESFDVLHDVYQSWVDEPKNDPPVDGFEPMPLPMEYVGDAEPKDLSN